MMDRKFSILSLKVNACLPPDKILEIIDDPNEIPVTCIRYIVW